MYTAYFSFLGAIFFLEKRNVYITFHRDTSIKNIYLKKIMYMCFSHGFYCEPEVMIFFIPKVNFFLLDRPFKVLHVLRLY